MTANRNGRASLQPCRSFIPSFQSRQLLEGGSRHGHEPGWKFFRRNDGPLREVVPKGHPLQPVEGRAVDHHVVVVVLRAVADAIEEYPRPVAVEGVQQVRPVVSRRLPMSSPHFPDTV